jgi:hypothetical protein
MLLFNISDGLDLGAWTEIEPDFVEELFQIVSQVSSCQIVSLNGVGKGITFVNWNCMSDTISSIQNQTSCSTWWVKWENGLNWKIECGNIKCLEHDFGHSLSVSFWISWSYIIKIIYLKLTGMGVLMGLL